MDIYKHHSNPSTLKHHDIAANHVPILIWNRYVDDKIKNIRKYKDVLAKDAYTAYLYALYVIKGRFPEGEPAIATSAKVSFWYARSAIKGRFPAGEKVIAGGGASSWLYARNVLEGRFIPGEPAIKDSRYKNAYELMTGIHL